MSFSRLWYLFPGPVYDLLINWPFKLGPDTINWSFKLAPRSHEDSIQTQSWNQYFLYSFWILFGAWVGPTWLETLTQLDCSSPNGSLNSAKSIDVLSDLMHVSTGVWEAAVDQAAHPKHDSKLELQATCAGTVQTHVPFMCWGQLLTKLGNPHLPTNNWHFTWNWYGMQC